jgi:hypothetical protein
MIWRGIPFNLPFLEGSKIGFNSFSSNCIARRLIESQTIESAAYWGREQKRELTLMCNNRIDKPSEILELNILILACCEISDSRISPYIDLSGL